MNIKINRGADDCDKKLDEIIIGIRKKCRKRKPEIKKMLQ